MRGERRESADEKEGTTGHKKPDTLEPLWKTGKVVNATAFKEWTSRTRLSQSDIGN